MILENHLTHRLFLVLVNCLAQNRKPFFLISKSFFQTLCNLSYIFFPYLLHIGEYSFFHFFRRDDFLYCCKQLFRNGTACIFMLCLADFRYNLVDKSND